VVALGPESGGGLWMDGWMDGWMDQLMDGVVSVTRLGLGQARPGQAEVLVSWLAG
jgi:hypothetical protein